ncbi:MAG: hypothetical protein EXR72_19845 [Myxococcales bacterium]|nr:hypothetical protein [Myxococcales bacterium]
MNPKIPTKIALFGLLVLATPARAGSSDLVIYAPGMGGDRDTAAPFVAAFTGYLEKQLKWPPKSANGVYLDDGKQARGEIEKMKPGFGLIPAWLYVDLACGKDAPEPISAVDGIAGMSSAVKFHLVVKTGGAKTLDELRGKVLISNHLQNPKFVSRVLLAGKVDAETFFKLKSTQSGAKPFKALLQGEADAALISDEQLKNKPAELPLTVLLSSEPLPPFPLVSFPTVVSPTQRDAVKRELIGMCAAGEGAQVCKSLRLTRFVALDPAAFKVAVQQYCK